MHTLAIVDDEDMIRKGLSTMVNWQQLGYELIGLFSSGEEMLDYLLCNSVDVILCDICMDHTSGLDVARFIFEENIDTCIVFLTAHQSFDYVKEALAYQVDDYLLKPTQLSELRHKFIELKVKLEKRDDQKQIDKQAEDGLSRAMKLIYNRFDVANGSGRPDTLELSDIKLHGNAQVYVFLVQVERYTQRSQDIQETLWSVIQQGNDQNNVSIIPSGEFHYFILLWCDLDNKNAYQFIDNKIDIINFSTGLGIKIIGSRYFKTEVADSGKNLRYDNQDIFDLVDTILDENIDQKITLQRICQDIYMNPSYFSRYFKQNRGIHFSSYLQTKRIDKAKELLSESDDPINEICEKVGMKSYKYFYQVFKKQEGISPNAYRQNTARAGRPV